MEEFIRSNLDKGNVIGPLKSLPTNFRASPLGAFIKKHSGKLRVIHDLSFPPGNSVNDCINELDCSVSYTKVGEAVELCKTMSEPWLAKTDLTAAYLSCPIRISDRPYLGFNWADESGVVQSYSFTSLCFGLKPSARLFDNAATALQYICIQRGASSNTIHYLDDLLTLSNSEQGCRESLDIIIETCKLAGFGIQSKKTHGPSRVIEFLGLIIDTVNKQVRISEERLREVRDELYEWANTETVTKRELLSIVGKLQFCAQVVRQGHMFTRRLIHRAKKVKNLHNKVKIDSSCKKDIKWWLRCMSEHNGISWFPH